MIIVNNPITIVSGGSSQIDLSTIVEVEELDYNPTESSPQLIRQGNIVYILAIGGVQIND